MDKKKSLRKRLEFFTKNVYINNNISQGDICLLNQILKVVKMKVKEIF